MKIKKVWRYICDHCHKGFFDKTKCSNHEKRCLKNLKRVCGFCESHEIKQAPMDMLMACLDGYGMDLPKLRRVAGGCPMCMLASIMEVNRREGFRRNQEDAWSFDYRKEMQEYDAAREHPRADCEGCSQAGCPCQI